MKRLNLITIALLGIAMFTSCTEEKPTSRTTYYRVTLTENNVKMLVASEEPVNLTLPGYEVGDVVWINTRNKHIDPADSVGMMAIIESCPDTLITAK